MIAADRRYLLELARELDDADRMGADEDVPEGVRYIQLSDTLAGMIAVVLREIVRREEADDEESGH